MKDLNIVLKEAKCKKIHKNYDEFKTFIRKVKATDDRLKMNWDHGAGEEWAFVNIPGKSSCMFHCTIGIVFVNGYDILTEETKQMISELKVVEYTNNSEDEWDLDIEKLKEEVPEVDWRNTIYDENNIKISLSDFGVLTI